MEIAIWGAGAVGIGLASALAGPGPPIRLIGRDPATLRALSEHGIQRSGLFGDLHVPPECLRIESDPACLSAQPPEWLLICTKAFASTQIAKALESTAACLSASTRMVLCQNGWGNESRFGQEPGETRQGCSRRISSECTSEWRSEGAGPSS